jgi:hypothetical protein
MEIEIEVVTADLPTGFDNPAHTVRGPRHVVTSGQTPVLDPAEARALLDSIDISTHAGLRDRTLIALMVYSFAPHAHGAAASKRLCDDRPPRRCGRHCDETRQP